MPDLSEKLLDGLDRLRAKPVYVRKRIAFVTTAVLSFFIATIWWNSWSREDSAYDKSDVQLAEMVSPWAVVRDSFVSTKDAALAAVGSIMNEVKSGAAVTESQ